MGRGDASSLLSTLHQMLSYIKNRAGRGVLRVADWSICLKSSVEKEDRTSSTAMGFQDGSLGVTTSHSGRG